MNRFEDADKELLDIFNRVINERFPSYSNLKFKLIYDTKRRMKKGAIVFASIEVPSPKIKFLSIDENAEEGYDYIIIVDRKAWDIANDYDKIRILSHELRHVFIDEKGNYKTIDHDISDFYVEIELNKDDPEWHRKLSEVVDLIYEQEKDMEKDSKGGK